MKWGEIRRNLEKRLDCFGKRMNGEKLGESQNVEAEWWFDGKRHRKTLNENDHYSAASRFP